ncbi:glycoside hydrolase family 32 protein [Vibrio scophthalmi]|uniref:Sucrose-6-phosphate hydrolase n=1 Tax=Vibrio scophthalmi LMG 19158 TaxID=870967 RepID=F9RQ29_9VIBR|nr:glycoside hydrolase family 32 protein [Vibrio scophthalmi]EGU34631.1 sucrose-6-phosphate hydrolase (Sucrase) [Vibrio scophthalmi LMG 19158]
MDLEKYKTINSATREESENFDKIRCNNVYRPIFHVTPPHGLLNDPNGFCYFNNEYHLFYQWYPFGTIHGMKHWMHLTSSDLYSWQEHGSKITPIEQYESHGAYSGAAFIEDNSAYLFYTGNVKHGNERDANQCLATLHKDNRVEKSSHNPIISSFPKGYTGHVRDPKIVKKGDLYYMLLGAQREKDLKGSIIIYSSNNLIDWSLKGELSIDIDADFNEAFMFECPDLLEVDGKDVLIFSPQGISPKQEKFHNRYNVVYCIGKIDWASLTFTVTHWDELDRGFDFYAPQTMANSPIEPTLIAWAGTDNNLPSEQYGWVNCLTAPRKLSIQDNKLHQTLVPMNEHNAKPSLASSELASGEVIRLESLSFSLDIDYAQTSNLSIIISDDFDHEFIFTVDNKNNKLVMDRTHYNHNSKEYEFGSIRSCILTKKSSALTLSCDQSIIELFSDQGRNVFTSLFFPSNGNQYLKITFDEISEIKATLQYINKI